MRTVDILNKSVYDDITPPFSVLVDYFGHDNFNNEQNICIIFGLYQGLIKFGFVKLDELHQHSFNNTLDSFIRKRYDELSSTRSSGYYNMFCEKNMKIDIKRT